MTTIIYFRNFITTKQNWNFLDKITQYLKKSTYATIIASGNL